MTKLATFCKKYFFKLTDKPLWNQKNDNNSAVSYFFENLNHMSKFEKCRLNGMTTIERTNIETGRRKKITHRTKLTPK